MSRKLLMSDFDGTLYFHDGRGLREKDVQAIRDFQKMGNLFVLCTGRPVLMRPLIQDKVKDRVRFDLEVFSCGSLIRDRNGNTVYEKTLPASFVREALLEYPEANFMIHHEKGIFYTRKIVEEGGFLLGSFEDLPEGKIWEMSLDFHDPKGFEAMEGLRHVKGISCYENASVADFVSEGVSKAEALKQALQFCGLRPEDSMAIGDSWNDIPMIEAAGVGITFPDSPEVVRNAADLITDGIAESLDLMESME